MWKILKSYIIFSIYAISTVLYGRAIAVGLVYNFLFLSLRFIRGFFGADLNRMDSFWEGQDILFMTLKHNCMEPEVDLRYCGIE